MDTFKNPLETITLIPIYTYLNILSDFLFTELYLAEIDQNKPIPIVNALYEYIQYYENNQPEKVALIRNLLEGSDLYGAKKEEHVDITFVNAMFEYIISSIVFDKYGSIYGFLADIFCKAETLQIEEVLNIIKINLGNTSYENEYGDRSILSPLSVDRIYYDIILPMFPLPKANLSLLSLDYIYAQAGSMFLRAGRINNHNYIDFKENFANLTEDNLFDEYLVIGHVMETLILIEEQNFDMMKAFALPALTHFIFNSKYLYTYENMANIISDPDFWQAAYNSLFQYTAKAFNDINATLKNDIMIKMHKALSRFQSITALTETFMELYCADLDENERNFTLSLHSNYSETIRCKNVNLTEYFWNTNYNINELYEIYDFQIVQDAFPKALIDKLDSMQVIIKLLIPNNITHGVFAESEHLAYDVLEVFFPTGRRFDYYILKRENYSAILTNYANTQIFTEDRLYFEKLFSVATSKILKRTDENVNVFIQNLVKYKKSRFESQLRIFDNCKEKNEQLKSDWWKEFGLSLVPYYPCSSDTCRINYEKICATRIITLFYKYPKYITLKTISNNSRSFLSSLGTKMTSLFLKIASNETVNEIVRVEQNYKFSITNALNRDKIFDDICLHIKDPAFLLTFTTKDKISVLKELINSLKEKTDFSFTSVIGSLSKISTLKSNFYNSIGTIDENNSRLIFVNTLNNRTDTGYGYKFIFVSDNMSKTAQLRTDYEFKNQILVSQIRSSEKEVKIYVTFNNVTFKSEPKHMMYEINNQLQRYPTKVSFIGISIEADDYDEKCNDMNYFKMWKPFNYCRRRGRFIEKSDYEERAVQFIKNNTNFSEKQIRNMFEKYTFPNSTTLNKFINDLFKNTLFEEPTWSQNYIIDNSNILSELRYQSHFEGHDIREYDAEFRISSFYSKAERRRIEENTSLKNIVKNYNEQDARYSVTFHDYYAIRNYVTTGYTRITGDTHEAKLMKLALYKLAIRQSDNLKKDFELKLFIVDSKPIPFLRTATREEYITLQKFTQAYTSIESAIRFAGYPAAGYVNIFYEMEFTGPYLRAKIEEFYNKKEKSVILLPGSKFHLEERVLKVIEGLEVLGKVLYVKLKYENTLNDKYEWYKKIMNKISRITF
ncbi:uncharacterized protein LOC127283643 [Leptopilina boulardi]|uniref:uncharacterized protein LOC127283643 n=1 Tax=Leptopilina boulardi TaxID=63433 RepID=UPI0021F56389|nr:uncharacterized protein LOC127283643 [Leptopilina boulardi]